MRRPVAAFAALAALIFAPLDAGAQAPAQVLASYTISGCAEGPLRYNFATSRYVQGSPVCFGGFTTLTVAPALVVPNRIDFRTEGTLTATLDPALEAAFVFVTGSEASILYPGCPSGCRGGFQLVGASTLLPGTPASLPIFGFAGSLAPDNLGAFQGLRAAVFVEYAVPDGMSASTISRRVDLTLTATPEPATLALTGAGLLVLAAAAGRRGRTHS